MQQISSESIVPAGSRIAQGEPASLVPLLKSQKSSEWYSLPEHIEAGRALMGTIELDPASCDMAQETVQADRYYTKEQDGLSQSWQAQTVWLNPPFCGAQGKWVARLVREYEAGEIEQAVLLVGAATETAWFQKLYKYPMCFVRGRIQFRSPDGDTPGPTFGSAFVYLGRNVEQFAALFSPFGAVVATVAGVAEKVEKVELAVDLEALRADYEVAREHLRREEEKREELERESEYQHQVWAVDNQVLNGNQKVVFLAVRSYILTLWHDSNALGQYVRVPMGEIALDTGLSTDTVGSAVKRLHKVGLVDRQERDAPKTKDGPPQTHIYVALTLLAYNPASIPPETPRLNHGGDRQLCKHCGSDKLVKRVVIVCKSCGRNQEPPEETPVNLPDPFALPDTEESSGLDSVQAAPVDVPVSVVSRAPTKPQSICYLCFRDGKKRVSSWVWMSNEGEYCCQSCYSPFSSSEQELVRQKAEMGAAWTPF